MRSEGFLVALDLESRSVLIIGGNEEALLRARNLRRAGALITLIAKAPCQELAEALQSELSSIKFLQREAQPDDLEGHWLAVFAEQAPEVAARFGAAAEAKRIFFCAIDQPEKNTFAHVGIARAGKLQLGISTSGAVPGIAGALKKQFQALLDRSEFEKIVEKLEEIRRNAPREQRGALLRAIAGRIRLSGVLSLEDEDRTQ